MGNEVVKRWGCFLRRPGRISLRLPCELARITNSDAPYLALLVRPSDCSHAISPHATNAIARFPAALLLGLWFRRFKLAHRPRSHHCPTADDGFLGSRALAAPSAR